MPLSAKQRVQFRAVVRFSIFDPEWTGWRSTNSGAFATSDDYREHLWSAARLEPRMRLFGQLSAPLLQEMAQEHDFRVLVQHSPTLPEPWISRLRKMAESYHVLRLVPVPGWVEARDTVAADIERDGRKRHRGDAAPRRR